MTFQEHLDRFHELQKEYLGWGNAVQIISWDWRAITPKKASTARADVIGLASAKENEVLCSAEMRETLEYLTEHADQLEQIDRTCVRLLKRDCDRACRVPADLFNEFSVLQRRSEAAWEEAKRTDNWKLYEPHLDNMFTYTRRMMDYWGFEGSPYNGILSYNEEGMTAEKLDGLFAEVRDGITPLVAKVAASKVEIDDSFRQQLFPVPQQRIMAQMILKEMGFDMSRGLIAESEHPYTCGFSLDDVRMTTHYYEDQCIPAIFSTLHEGGHGLYEQSYDRSLNGTMAGNGLGSGMHESVSRFWENIVGRDRAFWDYMMPKMQEIFPDQLKNVTAEQMFRAVNKSGVSLLRMEADELTYNLHIILRYELERDVFEGRVAVADLPKLWKQKMGAYLGIEPQDDRTGILQDIQWSMGQFGYFPAYALGNMYNAQYSARLKKELPFEQLLREGNLKAIYDWKQKNLYCHGSLYTPDELMNMVTGESLNAKYLVQHLTDKFTKLYEL